MAGTRRMLQDLAEINAMASADGRALCERADRDYRNMVETAAGQIAEDVENRHIVMFSGPSASGKTTTAHMIGDALRRKGIGVKIVSLDNFYRPASEAPLLEDGSRDLETVQALDVPLIQVCLNGLMKEGRAQFPVFDFHEGRRAPDTMPIELGRHDVIVIEGIHALDPVISQKLPEEKLYKLFISVQTPFVDKGEVILSPRDLRLCRRMLRDYWFRASSPEYTLELWTQVVRGETLYIEPNRGQAQFEIDSFDAFEPGLYRLMVAPLMRGVDSTNPYFRELCRIVSRLERFVPVPLSEVPPGSMVREFTGV